MIFVRNLRSPTMAADNLISHVTTLYLKELLLLGGWTYISDNTDPAWVTCTLVNELGGASGFQVAALSPRIVYSSAGVFTSAHVTNECALFLKATNSQNRVAARIVRYIDANNVEIDPDSAPPSGWINEGGAGTYIPGRIISPKAATLTATSAWVVLQAPTGNNHARILRNATLTTRCFSRPLGKLGTATETPTAGVDLTTVAASRFIILNAVFDGDNAMVYCSDNGATTENPVVMWGTLEEVATGDSNPNFIMGYTNMDGLYPPRWTMGMLDANPIPATIAAYISTLKYYGDQLGGVTYATINSNLAWRLQNGKPGKYALYRPLIVLANRATYGGGVRGRMPMIRTGNYNLERCRPVEAAGSWLHLMGGFIVPRNGPNDSLPQIAYAT